MIGKHPPRFVWKLCTCVLALALLSCEERPPQEVEQQQLRRLEGAAMGTYYRISYLGDEPPGLKAGIDSTLEAFNRELSLWVRDSKISVFNRSKEGISLAGTQHFLPNLELARRVSAATSGVYDPTVAPLVQYWGFGTGVRRTTAEIDSVEVRALRLLVGMEHISLEDDFLRKDTVGVALDLNASAKGYGVDLVSGLLNRMNLPNHLVDIGGEMRAGGTKYGRPWRVAIRLPEEDAKAIRSAGTLPLANGRAIATSGNYLEYYRVDGETFSHTINPLTGFVERNRLLSASVLAPDCATADAYATACMVLGPEEALALVERTPELAAYFLVRGEDGALEVVESSRL